ncbi:flavin reductase [Rhodococcus pseudokoreensis]|uniref:Flavin reductase n=1 Tax=Rhodococcus pseudokoreensis TaxID=2811421 RepID=A0A974ZWP2_9NOCA|nr:flavin reductase [Rhodococcus pseudokoreensis]QSE92727.1 flavin reductase [Rhodococcus pseudokoreensis]
MNATTTPTTQRFASAFRAHPGGVSIITGDSGGGPVALTATSVASISVEPPRLVLSLSDSSSSSPTLREVDSLVVHLLDLDDLSLAQMCATSGIDRFADTSLWRRMPTGEPYFHNASHIIRGQVVMRVRSASSTLVIVEADAVFRGTGRDEGSDHCSTRLVYQDRTWHRIGSSSAVQKRDTSRE